LQHHRRGVGVFRRGGGGPAVRGVLRDRLPDRENRIRSLWTVSRHRTHGDRRPRSLAPHVRGPGTHADHRAGVSLHVLRSLRIGHRAGVGRSSGQYRAPARKDAGRRLSVLIAGGGTGGHLMPALAIATALRQARPETRVVLVGAERGIEATLLSTRDFPY